MLDNAARLALLSEYEPLVRKIAESLYRRLPRSVVLDDLLAAGRIGLWDAISRQSGPPGDGFGWYLRVRIGGAIRDELRALDWLPRRARKLSGGDSLKVVYLDIDWHGTRLRHAGERDQSQTSDELTALLATQPDPEGDIDHRRSADRLKIAIDQLPIERDRLVIRQALDGRKFKDIGDALGISEPRVSQIVKNLSERLRLEIAKPESL